MTEHDLSILILLTICAVPANGYVLVYMTRPWYVTEPGRALMVKALANMGLINLGLATQIFGREFPGRDQIRMTLFILFAIGIWWLFIALLRTPRKYPPEP
ncbi:MAG TPA: hypothetical protein VJL80_00165, partial [Aeromicrobium sp.]